MWAVNPPRTSETVTKQVVFTWRKVHLFVLSPKDYPGAFLNKYLQMMPKG